MKRQYTHEGTMTTYTDFEEAVNAAADHFGADSLLEFEITELRFDGDTVLPSSCYTINWRGFDDWNLVDGGAA